MRGVRCALGLTATSFGSFLGSHALLLRQVAGVLIFVFGLQVAGLLRFSWLYRERRFEVRHRTVGPARSLLLGAAFAFGWTPCVGPILFSVLSYAANAGSVSGGQACVDLGKPQHLVGEIGPVRAYVSGGPAPAGLGQRCCHSCRCNQSTIIGDFRAIVKADWAAASLR